MLALGCRLVIVKRSPNGLIFRLDYAPVVCRLGEFQSLASAMIKKYFLASRLMRSKSSSLPLVARLKDEPAITLVASLT
jgi:hypothetical protein